MTETPTTPASTRHHAKIAIIGGGNQYCASLIQSIVQHPQALKGCHIVLMDTDVEKLELLYTISRKLFQHAEVDVTIEYTTNQEEAIDDASFVLTAFRTGGLHACLLDEQIAHRHGIIAHDAIGPGGFSYALRTAPVLAGIAADVEKLAPSAFLLNYANPSTIVMEAIAHSSGIRVIGLTNNAIPGIHLLSQVESEAGKKLYPRTVGLNHGSWTTALWHNGKDILPQIVKWCKGYISTQPEITPTTFEQVMNATLTAHYEAIPSPSLYAYYFSEIVLELQRSRSTSPLEDMIKQSSQAMEYFRQEAEKKVPQVANWLQEDNLGDFALSILNAILNDTGEEWVLNVQNNGSINFLAEDRVVELPCRVDARGAIPLTQGDGGLALDQRGLIISLAEYEGATARVALWGSRRDAIKALAANPLVLSYSKAEKIYADLAAAHAQYLPERLLN